VVQPWLLEGCCLEEGYRRDAEEESQAVSHRDEYMCLMKGQLRIGLGIKRQGMRTFTKDELILRTLVVVEKVVGFDQTLTRYS